VSERLQPNQLTRVIHGTINRVSSPLLRVRRNVWYGKQWRQTILYNLQYYNNDNIWKTTCTYQSIARTRSTGHPPATELRFHSGRILNNMLFEIMLLPWEVQLHKCTIIVSHCTSMWFRITQYYNDIMTMKIYCNDDV